MIAACMPQAYEAHSGITGPKLLVIKSRVVNATSHLTSQKS